MNSLVMLSRIDNDALMDFDTFQSERELLRKRLDDQCPDVRWRVYYLTLGEFDVINLLRARDYEQLLKASRFIQSFQGMKTEVVFATRWHEFEDFVSPAGRRVDRRKTHRSNDTTRAIDL